MAHYAFLDQNNMVVSVIVGNDEDGTNTDWEAYYGSLQGMTCKRTSYNTHRGVHYDPDTNTPSADQSKAFRKNYAGIGYTYDSLRDAFIPPKPFLSWSLDEFSCDWKAPVPYPTDGKEYVWDEETLAWAVAFPEGG